MTKNEQTYIDKTSWKQGDWTKEPDRVSWVDPKTGYDCLIRRNRRSGILCGYVSVGKNHPTYGIDCFFHLSYEEIKNDFMYN